MADKGVDDCLGNFCVKKSITRFRTIDVNFILLEFLNVYIDYYVM